MSRVRAPLAFAAFAALAVFVVLAGWAGAAAASPASLGACRAAPGGIMVDAPTGARISVRTVGRGRPVLLIPSHGRGRADFDDLAARLARQGFMSILAEPRGINASTGPAQRTLFDLADDLAAVTGALCHGRVDVVGHAFGNRVARAFATRYPQKVARVALLAGGGEVPIPPKIMTALEGAMAQGRKPDADRLEDIRLAFFAKGHDPRVWLYGWYPDAATAEMVTVKATPSASWWTAGGAPLLLVQAEEDPIAPAGNAEALRRAVGDRLTLVTLRHASHAMLPEQPGAIATALTRYFNTAHPSEAELQAAVDRAARP